MANKIYHIYAKGECLYNNLNEEQFQQTWSQLQGMVGLMRTDYSKEDLSYEQVYTLMEGSAPAGEPSY